jgi:hypothetical protein
MKPLITILSLAALLSQSVKAQDSVTNKSRTYQAVVVTMKNVRAGGYLSNLADSAACLATYPVHLQLRGLEDVAGQRFRYSDIQQITLKRKGRVGRGILAGVIIGTIVGGIAGLIAGGDSGDSQHWVLFTPAEAALAGAAGGCVTGAALGAIISALAKDKFMIGGSKQKYQAMREAMIIRMTK